MYMVKLFNNRICFYKPTGSAVIIYTLLLGHFKFLHWSKDTN